MASGQSLPHKDALFWRVEKQMAEIPGERSDFFAPGTTPPKKHTFFAPKIWRIRFFRIFALVQTERTYLEA